MWLPLMSVPTRGRGKKICSLCRLTLRNSFCCKVRVPMSKKMDKRSYADVSATRTQTSLSRYNLRAVACASSPVTHVLRSPLCEARRETKRPRRRLLMYYLAGSEVPQYAKFCSTIIFFVYRSFCPLPLIDLFRFN